MRRRSLTLLVVILALVALLVQAACTANSQGTTATAQPAVPTAPPATETPLPTSTSTPVPSATASPTPLPTATVTTVPTVAATATATATAPPSYQVVYVAPDDMLNVRARANASAPIEGRLAPGATGISAGASGEMAHGHLWLPVETEDTSGWVNSLYLTETVDPSLFCEDPAVNELLDAFQKAVANRTAPALLETLDPERGLHARTAWWNPDVWLQAEELESLFSSTVVHDWGVADGSGAPIVGTFSEVIQPLLQEDLLAATESACNEILHGGTAGIVQLPAAYEGINYYSFFRPPTPEYAPFDWGTWVIGVERWQGDYHVSFLVHFAWEI